MEEKKKINVSAMLVIISIVVIIIMGSCLYILFVQRSEKNNTIKEELDFENIEEEKKHIIPEEYIGTWEDEYDGSQIIIKSINSNRMLFDVNIVRIGGYENLVGEIKSDSLVIFNTNNTDTGEFWEGVYGTLTFQEDKVILEITESECEYVHKGLKIEGVNNKKKYSNTLKEMEYYTESYLYKNEENGTEIETLLPPNESLNITHMEKDLDGNIIIIGDIYTVYTISKKELEEVKNGKVTEFAGVKYKYEDKEFQRKVVYEENGDIGIYFDTGELLSLLTKEQERRLKNGENVNIDGIEYWCGKKNDIERITELKYKEGCFVSIEDKEEILFLGNSEQEEYKILDEFEVRDESGEYLFMRYSDYFWTGKSIKIKVNKDIKEIGLTWIGDMNFDFLNNEEIYDNIENKDVIEKHYNQYIKNEFLPIEHFNFIVKDGEIVEYWLIRSDYMAT